MAKGHLLITPTTRSKDVDEDKTRQSCFRTLTIADIAILLAGLQLAILVGYLLRLTTCFDADTFHLQRLRVDSMMLIVPAMMGIVTVSGHRWLTIGQPAIEFRALSFCRSSPIAMAEIWHFQLLVFGIVGKRLWMIIPSVLVQLTFIIALIAAAAYLGQKVARYPVLNPELNKTQHIANQHAMYKDKVHMAYSIVGIVLSILCLVVMVLCLRSVFISRNQVANKEKHENGY